MSTPNESRSQLVGYTYLAHLNIHQFTVYVSHRDSVDELLGGMTSLYERFTPHDPVYMLMDYRPSGVLPLAYSFSQTRRWIRQLPVHPPARVALVYGEETQLLGMITRFLKTMQMGHLTASFFGGESAYEDALAWLTAR